jgi:putative transposase
MEKVTLLWHEKRGALPREELEPCAVRAASTVLRGGRHSNVSSLPDPDHAGWKLTIDEVTGVGRKKKLTGRLHLTKIGTLKVKLPRPIGGTIKTVTIKREGDHWFAVFTCEVEDEVLSEASEDVGIDLGMTHFAALSTGEFIDHPRYFRNGEKKLARKQQALSKKQKGSHRRKKAVKQVAKCHRKIKNQRRDFQHKASRKLVNQYQVIAFEDLQIKNLVKRPKSKQDETTGQYLPNGASAKSGLTKPILKCAVSAFVG